MTGALKSFIEETIDLIEEDKWSDVAYKAESWLVDNRFIDYDMIEFWEIVREDLGIDILKFEDVEIIPSYYCCNADKKEIIIPARILHINHSAFMMCKNLKKVTLPNTLYSIHQSAFSYTPNLTEIEFDGTLDGFKRIRLGWNAFGAEILGRNGKKLITKDGVMIL